MMTQQENLLQEYYKKISRLSLIKQNTNIINYNFKLTRATTNSSKLI